jgi:hypothetical protein
MTLSTEQSSIINQLSDNNYFQLISKISGISKQITNAMCNDEFIEKIRSLDFEAFRLIPKESVTVKIVMRDLAHHNSIYDEIEYFDHLLGDEDFVDHLINNYCDSIMVIPAKYLKDKHYINVVERELSSNRTSSEYLEFVPEKYLDYDKIRYILAHDSHVYSEKAISYFSLDMLPYFVDNCSPVLSLLPEFMANELTKSDLKKIIDKDILMAIKLKTSLMDVEMIDYSLNAMGEDNRGFNKFYEIIENKTLKLIKSVYEKGFYSAVLFDDLMTNNIQFNPIKLYHTALKNGSKQSCVKRVLKNFSSKEIGQFFLLYKSKMTQKEIKQTIKDLSIDHTLEEEFICPCSGKPLSKALIDEIRKGYVKL